MNNYKFNLTEKGVIALLFCCSSFLAKTQTVITFAGSIAGYKDSVGVLAEFNAPNGIAVDNAGNIFITDQGNNRIRKITPAHIVSTVAGNGNAGFADGQGTSAEFNVPTRIAVDVNDNLYVSDEGNNRIRKITPAGIVSTLAGNGVGGFADGPGTTAEFSAPTGVAVDTSGNVYVADQLNNCIRKITPDGVVSTYAGNRVGGFSDGSALNAEFNHPIGTAVDLQGNVYVSDWLNDRIRKITPAGIVSTFAGNGISGYKDGRGADAEFQNTLGAMRVSVDTAGNVYVADQGNQRVRKITPDAIVSTIAGNGIKGYLDTLALNAEFSYPSGATADLHGNIFITDFGNNRIRELTDASTSLPIGLLNFSAQIKNKDPLLTWQTATEENSDYFNILLSTDGLHFFTRGKIAAAGNSNTIKSYTYIDVNAAALNTTTLYYRLEEIDKDGKSINSGIQLIRLSKKILITVTPNPVNDFINISSSVDLKNTKISLIDISGKRYYSSIENLVAGSRFQIPVTQLSRGTFIVSVENNDVKKQVTLIK